MSVSVLASQIHRSIFDTNVIDPESEYSTFVVPLEDTEHFPWDDIGRRSSKERRRGAQVDASYTPQLALTRVATFGDDVGEEAGECRSDGGWISVGAGRPYVPLQLSDEEAVQRLHRHMPEVRPPQPNNRVRTTLALP